MYKVVDKYVGRTVAGMVVFCTIGLVSLSSLIKFVDQLRNVGRGEFDFVSCMQYVLLTVPGQISMFFPLGVLLGTVLALGNLASTSELIAMQALGKSKMRIVWSACKSVIPLIFVIMLLGEYVVPDSEKRAESLISEAVSNGQVAVTSRGIWFREGNSFINIAYFMSDGDLQSVTRYIFNDSIPKKLVRTESASRGYWKDDKWKMEDIRITTYADDRIVRDFRESDVWDINLTPANVEVVGVHANDLSISGLHEYIRYVTKNGQKADRYILELYRKIISPITVLVVLLLASSTIFGPLRSSSMGARIVVGILVGFSFYAVNEILAPFTIFYGVPPLIGAISPTLIVLAIAVYLLRKNT